MAALLGLDNRRPARENRPRGVGPPRSGARSPTTTRRGQIVVSGQSRTPVERAIPRSPAETWARGRSIPAAGQRPPFIPPLMHTRRRDDGRGPGRVRITGARPVPLVANVTGPARTTDPGEIKQLLVEQVTHMVRWARDRAAVSPPTKSRKSSRWAPARVLAGLTKRIDREPPPPSINQRPRPSSKR